MSGTPPDIDATSTERVKPIEPMRLLVGVVVLGLVLLAIVVFALNMRAEGIRVAELRRSADAISVLLRDPVLARDNAKMARILQDTSVAAGYSRMTVTGAQGLVLASTDRTLQGKTIKGLTTAQSESRKVDGKQHVTRAILLGSNNVIGGLEIVE